MRLIGILFLLLSAAGSAALLFAAGRARRLGRTPPPATGKRGVTILKPLHGDEPRLLANLETFLGQDHGGPVQMVCGVQDRADPAIGVVAALRAAHPQADIALVVDPAAHGANAKIGNLANMLPHARHDILVLSDSDMAVPPDYLARVLGALDAPGVGAATCLYRGRGDAGGWSRLAAMGIGQHFLPGVLIGTALGLAEPCMGSTIALRRGTLAAIGGFAAFADELADDYAIGAAVRGLGLRVALPDLLLAHGCRETGLAALLRQELRWQRTVLAIDPAGHAGSLVLHPLPLALAGFACMPGGWGLAAAAAALGARGCLALAVDRAAGERAGPLWWLPVRDILSFAVFVASFLGRSVDWRGRGFHIKGGGRIAARQDDPR